MKIVLDIPDHQLSFGMKVLKSLSFVKKVKPISKEASDLWQDLEASAKDVKLHKEGHLKLKSAQEFLDEL